MNLGCTVLESIFFHMASLSASLRMGTSCLLFVILAGFQRSSLTPIELTLLKTSLGLAIFLFTIKVSINRKNSGSSIFQSRDQAEQIHTVT